MRVSRPPIAVAITLAVGLAVVPLASAQGSVALTVLPQRTHVTSGHAMRVALRVSSTGTADATSVSACLAPPAQLSILHSGGGSRMGRSVCFTLGDIAPGTQVTRSIEVRAASMHATTVQVVARSASTCQCAAATRAWSPAIRVLPAPARARVTG